MQIVSGFYCHGYAGKHFNTSFFCSLQAFRELFETSLYIYIYTDANANFIQLGLDGCFMSILTRRKACRTRKASMNKSALKCKCKEPR